MIEILRNLMDGTQAQAAFETQALLDWRLYLIILLGIVIGTTVHEFGHAWMADRLGDPLPRQQKRVTLNPLSHLDPLGTLLLAVTLLVGFPLGWGRPVRTDPENYTCGEKTGIGLVAVAGPLMNLLTAIALAPLARIAIGGGFGRGPVAATLLALLAITMLINLSLFCFNLVPVAPLDGSHIVGSLLPEPYSSPFRSFMSKYGPYVLVGLMFSGVLGKIIGPLIVFLFRLLIGR